MKRKMSVLALCLAAVLTITGLSAGKVQASPKVYTGNNQRQVYVYDANTDWNFKGCEKD